MINHLIELVKQDHTTYYSVYLPKYTYRYIQKTFIAENQSIRFLNFNWFIFNNYIQFNNGYGIFLQGYTDRIMFGRSMLT